MLGEKHVLDNEELKIDLSSSENTTKKTTKKTVEIILENIKENPQITAVELAEIVGLTPDGVRWNLNKLKSINKLRRVGPDKGGYWEVLE